MKITKKWEKVLTNIFELLNIKLINELNFDIPPNLYNELNTICKTIKDPHIEHLSTHYVRINAFSKNKSREIKIWFGPVMKLKAENEIIIKFEYASELIFHLIRVIEPSKVEIKTKEDLFERESIFSQPFSTFDEYLKK